MEQIRRTRREGRAKPSFGEDRVRGTCGQNATLDKAVTKNPTRFVPDLPGFSCLTKNEIKKDTWDVDKRSSLMDMNETDSEDEEEEQTVMRSMGPPCASESTAYKKKIRLTAWLTNPSLVDGELREESAKLEIVKAELLRLISLEEDWIYTLEMGRGQVCSSLSASREIITDLKANTELLYDLMLSECGGTARKKKSVPIRGGLQELQERLAVIQMRIKDYELVSSEFKSSGKSPTTFVELDELDYPEDAVVFVDRLEGEGKEAAPTVDEVIVETAAAAWNPDFDGENSQHAEALLVEGQGEGQGLGQGQELNQHHEHQEHEAETLDADDDENRSEAMNDLLGMVKAVEEATRLSEAALGDLDIFFNDEDEPVPSPVSLNAVGVANSNNEALIYEIECEKSKKLVPTLEAATQLAFQVDSIRAEVGWARHLKDIVSPAGSGGVLRKRRRGPVTVPISAFVFPRTPRGVPLLISPLSQFEDHYLGAMMVATQNLSRQVAAESMPSSMYAAEDAVLERCRLQSAAAAAQSKIRKMRSISMDWKRQLLDGDLSLGRIEKTYQQAAADDYQEAKRIRKDLLQFGLASAGSDELPMSPIAETSGWGFSSGKGRGDLLGAQGRGKSRFIGVPGRGGGKGGR